MFNPFVPQLYLFFQLLVAYIFNNGLDNLRAIVGPLPPFMCKSIIFFKNFFHCNVSQFIVAITATKFCFVCIYKSIPTMNDNFLATFLYLTINMNSFIITTVMMELPGRYPLNFVSVNIFGYLNNMH